MALSYSNAREVADVAEPMIAKVHPHLTDVEVRYVFRSEAAKRGGNVLLGDVKRISGLASYFAHIGQEDYPLPSDTADENSPAFFALVIAGDLWALMERPQREALVDHLLSKCRVEQSENGARLSVVSPEGAEFAPVMARRGMWRKALQDLVGAAYRAHPTLFVEEEISRLTIVVGSTHATASVTVTTHDDTWEVRCSACGTVFTDDVMVVAERAASDHRAWHATQLAAEEGDDEGDESFGDAFDAKLDALAAND